MKYQLLFPITNYGEFVHRWRMIIPSGIKYTIYKNEKNFIISVDNALDIYEIASAEAAWIIDKPTEMITVPTKILCPCDTI